MTEREAPGMPLRIWVQATKKMDCCSLRWERLCLLCLPHPRPPLPGPGRGGGVLLSPSSQQGEGEEWAGGWGASSLECDRPASEKSLLLSVKARLGGGDTDRLTGQPEMGPSPQWSWGFGDSLWPQLRLNKPVHDTSSPATCLATEHKLSL